MALSSPGGKPPTTLLSHHLADAPLSIFFLEINQSVLFLMCEHNWHSYFVNEQAEVNWGQSQILDLNQTTQKQYYKELN